MTYIVSGGALNSTLLYLPEGL